MLPYRHTGKSTANEHGGMSKHTKEESITNILFQSLSALQKCLQKPQAVKALVKTTKKISVRCPFEKQKATSEVLLAINRLRQDQTNNYK